MPGVLGCRAHGSERPSQPARLVLHGNRQQDAAARVHHGEREGACCQPAPIIDQEQLENGGSYWIEGYHRHLWDGGEPVDYIPPRLRRLTIEEAAAIQTFPLGWRFFGTQSAQFRQIGNAVPPNLAYHVALA